MTDDTKECSLGSENQTLLDAGAASARLVLVDDVHPLMLVPEGYQVHDCERYLSVPTRQSGVRKFFTLDSFCAYVKLHKVEGPTRVYAQSAPPRFACVFNDHCPDTGPGWRDFGASYDCPLSAEWRIWTGSTAKRMAQAEFAQFIEDNAPDCVEPDSATMIEVARSLEAKKSVRFASDLRLDSGARELSFETQIAGTAGKGKLQIPEVFTLGLAVLDGGPRYAVAARLRYRIDDAGKLSMWYDLVRPHKVLDDAVREAVVMVKGTTGLDVYMGG